MRESEARLQALLSSLDDLVFELDRNGTYLGVWTAHDDLLAAPRDALLGHTVCEALGDELGLRMIGIIGHVLATGVPEICDFRLEVPAGTRWFEGRLAPIAGTGSFRERICLLVRDVTAQKLVEQTRDEAEEMVRHQALHDDLTGLPNRVKFRDRLEHALERSVRSPSTVAVLSCGLDHFHSVNDSLGHLAGDAVLIEVAERLSRTVRTEDTLARVGGDKFLVCREQVLDPVDVREMASRMLAALAAPVVVAGNEVFVTASVGIRTALSSADTAEDLIRDAEIAMHQAKSRGRDCVAEFNAITRDQIQQRLQIQSDLHRALERHELRVYYQPILNIETGTLAGFEALVRWQHPERGLIMPADFIPVAEESGLIIPLGSWVMEQSCRMLKSLNVAGTSRITMAVNISARQIQVPDFVDTMADVLRRTNVDPNDVCLEMTESVLMEDADASAVCLDSLKRLGVHVAIDDFGTGYSSLSYLRHLPVDFVKIDRSFVAHLGTESEATAIVTAVVHLARSLGLATVAEGVETVEQLVALQLLRCDLGQGYYWSRPMPGPDVAAWIGSAQVEPSRVQAHEQPVDEAVPERFRVVVADDEPTHRAMVARVLETSGRFEVVSQVGDGREAAEVAGRDHPDLVVLDLSMPRMGGLEALPRILGSSPNTKVVLYSGSEGRRGSDLPEGASAFLRKTLNPSELIEELLLVMGGRN
ncbi:MAG: EAL domain-containing protein [Acidimicrobiales bacterium]